LTPLTQARANLTHTLILTTNPGATNHRARPIVTPISKVVLIKETNPVIKEDLQIHKATLNKETLIKISQTTNKEASLVSSKGLTSLTSKIKALLNREVNLDKQDLCKTTRALAIQIKGWEPVE
jgi:hypothetical protein